MALVAGEFKSGGRVVDRFGRDSLKTEAVGSAPAATNFKSGGVMRDVDGRIVVVVETLNAALTAGSIKSGGRLFDQYGRLIVAVSNVALTSGEVLSGGEVTDNKGRVVVNNEVLDAAYSAGDYNSGGSGRGPFGRRLVAGASSFSPASVPGLAAWFKADSLGLADGTAVSSWTDLSGNARHAVQAVGASQPIYKTGIVNGHSVLRFDGTDDFLDCAGIIANTAARTLLIVAKQASPVSFAAAVNLGKAGSATGGLAPISSVWNYFHNQTTSAVAVGGSAAAFAQLCVRWNSAASCDVFVGTGAATNFDPIDTYSTALTDLFIGSWDGSATIGPFFNGDIPELLIYNAAISEPNRLLLRDYFTTGYGV